MAPYFAIALVTTGLAALSARVSEYLASASVQRPPPARLQRMYWTPFDFAAVALLVAFSGLRYNVGTDYSLYARYFEHLDPRGDWMVQVESFQQELLYTWLALGVKSVADNPQAIFWVTSVLTVIPIYMVVRRESRDLPFAMLLYVLLAFYVAPFNIVRQGISISLAFLAYSYLSRRKWLVFLVLGAAAVLFHASAAVAIPLMVAARHWKPTLKSTVIALMMAGVSATVLFAAPSTAHFAGLLNERYASYVLDSRSAGLGTYLLVAAYVVMLVVLVALRRYVERLDWLAIFTIGVVFAIIGTQSLVVVRMYHYFGIFGVLLIPNALAKRPGSAILKTAMIAGAGLYFIAYLLNYGGLLPYQTAF